MSEYASCCVLSYERPQFLNDCLSSLMLAGSPLELIIHDDGSRGAGPELDRWSDHATIITNPQGCNRGQGVALNRMFHMASGDPIIKIDQDVVFTPGWLAKVQRLMRANPQIGLLGLFHYWHPPCDSAVTRIHNYDGWSSRTHILGSAFAVSRACWQELGPFAERDEAFAEDWNFQKRVTASGMWVCALPDEDLVSNQGFGIGPSTVVLAGHHVQPIHKEPVLLCT